MLYLISHQSSANYSIIISKLRSLIVSVVDKDVEQLELSYTAVGNVNWCSHFGKQFGVSKVEDRQFLETLMLMHTGSIYENFSVNIVYDDPVDLFVVEWMKTIMV